MRLRPSPLVMLDIADDCLVGVDCDVLDRDLLLTTAAVVVEPLGE